MITLCYKGCKKEFEVPEDSLWNLLGERDAVSCPHCGQTYTLYWDESYDPESGEEWGYFTISNYI